MIFHRFEQFLVVEITFLKGFFDNVIAFRFAVNGEVCADPHFRGVHAQNAYAHAVNGAHPRVGNIHNARKAFFHLVRRFVGKRDRQNRRSGYAFFFDEISNARSEHARLAATRARQHEHRAFRLQHGFDLFVV